MILRINLCSTSSLYQPEESRARALERHKRGLPSGLLSELKKCSRLKNIKRGKELHSEIATSGLSGNILVVNSLINMYSKCGDMEHARNVFEEALSSRDVVSWTALLMGYAENGEHALVLDLFESMNRVAGGCAPDARVYVAALWSCGALASSARHEPIELQRWLAKGREIHSGAVKDRCCDIFVQCTLVDMYGKCKSMQDARNVFDGMASRDTATWNALLNGYVENGENKVALELFDEMVHGEDSCIPNSRTYIAAVSACGNLTGEDEERWLAKGKEVHSQAAASKCCSSFVENTLIVMYGRHGEMELARQVFDRMSQRRDIVSWNALLQGYVDNGESKQALELFDLLEAVQGGGCVPNERTYVVALSACGNLGDGRRNILKNSTSWLEKAKVIHSKAAAELSCFTIFIENTLVDVYSKCGDMVSARDVFERMTSRTVVSWTALIMGYVVNGENVLALELVHAMEESGVQKDARVYLAALKACGELLVLETGKSLHAEIKGTDVENDVVVANSLVDFYGRCGIMESAKLVFDGILRKTVVSWNSLLCGYSLQGDATKVLELFQKMEAQENVVPDEVTFACLLSACSHAGLIDTGRKLFSSMPKFYSITPNMIHYSCFVDLLARSNRMEEALEVIQTMPFQPNARVWKAVLSACKKWRNVAVGRRAYEALLRLEDGDISTYLLMKSIVKTGESDKWRTSESWWSDGLGRLHEFTSSSKRDGDESSVQ